MYFTIENPDLQMLSEFHKVKKIAEESNKEKNIFLLDISNQMKVPLQKINTIGKQVLMENDIYLAKDGRVEYGFDGECTLFPSKDQRDWSKFKRFWDKPKVEMK